MNGVHDLGGRMGFGAVTVDEDEKVFYADWEREIFGVIMLYFMTGQCGLDKFRWEIEKMEATEYLSTPYFMHWMRAAEAIAFENGLFTADELEERVRSLQAEGASA